MRRLTTTLAATLAAAFALCQGVPGKPTTMTQTMTVAPAGAMTLMRKDVQEDLKLSDAQKEQLVRASNEAVQQMQSMMREMIASGNREGMKQASEKMQAHIRVRIDEILTPEQSTRLREIQIQLAGNRAVLTMPDVRKAIGLSEDQTERLKDLEGRHREAQQSLMRKASSGEMAFEDVPPIARENDQILVVEIDKILSKEQRLKLKALGGKEFKPSDPEMLMPPMMFQRGGGG